MEPWTEPIPRSPEGKPYARLGWRSPGLLIALSALVVCAIAFAPTLHGGFLSDDFGYVGRFARFSFSEWPRLFVHEWSGGMWENKMRELRPITALSFIVDAHLWGVNATGFRITNLLLHAGCATLVGGIAWRAAGRELACGIAAAVLFALHPVHVEPVLWITGRVDVLATLFYLAAFGAFWRFRDGARTGWLVAGVLAYAAAIFSKEFGLTLLLMLLLADGLRLTRAAAWRAWSTWAPYLGCGAVTLVYYFCRRAAFSGRVSAPSWPDFEGLRFWMPFAKRQLVYLAELFPPLARRIGPNTSAFNDHPIATVAGIFTAGIVALTTLSLWLRRSSAGMGSPARERRDHSEPIAPNVAPLTRRDAGISAREAPRALLFFGPAWYLVATLPLLVTYISARHLYLASAGWCVIAVLVLRLVLRSRWTFAGATLAMAAFLGVRLATATAAWREAGELSREIAREVSAFAREAKPGAALVLDVPRNVGAAHSWEFALPFAVRPPFTPAPLDAQFAIVAPKPVYFKWERWSTQPAIARLADVSAESWLVLAAEGAPVKRIAVAPEKLRPAAQRFAAAAADPTKDDPGGAWRQFVDELTRP